MRLERLCQLAAEAPLPAVLKLIINIEMTTSISIKKFLVGVVATVLLASPMFAMADFKVKADLLKQLRQEGNEHAEELGQKGLALVDHINGAEEKLKDAQAAAGKGDFKRAIQLLQLIQKDFLGDWKNDLGSPMEGTINNLLNLLFANIQELKQQQKEAATEAAGKKREAAAAAVMMRIGNNVRCMTRKVTDAITAEMFFGFSGKKAFQACNATLTALRKAGGFVLPSRGFEASPSFSTTLLTYNQCSPESRYTKRVVDGNIIWTDPATGEERNLGSAVCNAVNGQYISAGERAIMCSVIPPPDSIINSVIVSVRGIFHRTGCERESPPSSWHQVPPIEIDLTDFGQYEKPSPTVSPDVRVPPTPQQLKSTAAPRNSLLGSLLRVFGR